MTAAGQAARSIAPRTHFADPNLPMMDLTLRRPYETEGFRCKASATVRMSLRWRKQTANADVNALWIGTYDSPPGRAGALSTDLAEGVCLKRTDGRGRRLKLRLRRVRFRTPGRGAFLDSK